ncbi:MAG: nuclear transport factor 2 family protein [Gammaproteobacteria bacterium]|nr:nuclear transport factor 2 family protein [Gammaproteobacteria bacterium]
MSSDSYIESARVYVQRSNAHDLEQLRAMFESHATYHSSYAGDFEGRDIILSMMQDFFARFPDVTWTVPAYHFLPDYSVRFEFVMTATDKESGERIERHGLERIDFSSSGLISHIDVQPKSE